VKGRPVTTSASKGLGAWRRLVSDVAQRYAPPELWEGPIRIVLTFGIQKPKSAPKRRRVWPDKRPDLDKLVRGVIDSLTHIVFADDSQIVEIQATKDYGPPGVAIEVHRVIEIGPDAA
jgi:crossover junction endodeoxyribonuclease RusA